MTQKEQKNAIRKELLQLRDSLDLNQKARLDLEICDRLFSVIRRRNAGVIHSYLPFGSEPDINPLLQQLLDAGLTVVCPKSLAKRTIQNLVLSSLDELEEGRFGTKHPAGGNEYTGSIDLYIVPGIAFDDGCYRLGYGSGYYDAWFSANPEGYKVGICYPFQRILALPNEEHDIPLNEIIS
ncbi:MAG: 5-formyltetrahydrofolate cyclo-ligase [Taibaiella sp.]|nr:5-formyltetrahydrofolate cyclo-ligase [Taibaiella sp.]